MITNRPPPQEIPAVMKEFYNLENSVAITTSQTSFHDESATQGHPQFHWNWTHQVMEELIDAAKVDELYKRGGGGDPYKMAVKLRQFFNTTHVKEIRGKRCAVLGSQAPWIEAILLSLGAE